jgi:hypothetical protein
MDLPSFWSLTRHYTVTSGEVIDVRKGKHPTVEIRYRSGGVLVTRAFPAYARAAPGDSVPVYYSTQDPSSASLAPPSEIWAQDLPHYIAMSLILSLLITFGMFRVESSRHYLFSV